MLDLSSHRYRSWNPEKKTEGTIIIIIIIIIISIIIIIINIIINNIIINNIIINNIIINIIINNNIKISHPGRNTPFGSVWGSDFFVC